MMSKLQHLLDRSLTLSQSLMFLLLAVLPIATWAQDCVDYFPDAVSNNENNGRIEFSSNARVINSPDNILESRDIRDSAGTNVSCNGVSCSESGSVVARSNYNNFPNNNNDISVTSGGFLSLAPGNYDDITVNSSGTLSLSAGDYHLRDDLKVSSSASIVVSGSGRTRIFVRDKVEFESGSQINAAGGSNQLLIYARDKIEIYSSSVLRGLFYSRDDIDIDSSVQIVGAITGSKINLSSSSTVTYAAAALSGDFGAFCTGSSTLPSGLVVEWQMDELSWSGVSDEVVDTSGNNNHGTASGSQTQSVSPTQMGNPATCRYGSFDGNDYINSTFDMSETAAAVSLWFRTSNANGGLFVAKAGGVTHGAHDRNIYLSGGNVRARLWSEQTIATSGTNYADGNWHHVVFTYGAAIGGQRLYIDGSLAASGTKSSSNFTWQSNIMVGYSQNGYGGYFNGDIDEVLIFDNALSASEVTSVYSNQQLGNNWDGSPRVCPTVVLAPVAEYRMDESAWAGVAGEVADSSANSYNGTALGSTTTAGLLCNAGDFSTGGISDYLSLDSDALNGRSDFSISVWAQTTKNSNQSLVSGSSGSQHNELIMWFPNGSTFSPYLKGSGSGGSISTGGINDGDWHHLVWTRAGSQNCLFVDGVIFDCKNRPSSALNIASGGLIIGQEQDSLGGGFQSSQGWEGLLDEMLIFDNALTAPEIASIHSNQQLGNNWDGSPRTCPVALTPVAEYNMSEVLWNGTGGEVEDSSGNGHDGRAVTVSGQLPSTDNTSPTPPDTCRYGVFDGPNTGFVQIDDPGTNSMLDITDNLTVSAWVYPRSYPRSDLMSVASKDENWEFHLRTDGRVNWWFRHGNFSSSSAVPLNQWTHITLVYQRGIQTIYMNGVANSTASYTQLLTTQNDPVLIGTDLGINSRTFDGFIDELRIYDLALTQSQVQDVRDVSRPCFAPVADWHMDESGWNNTTGEVIDSSTNSYNGTAFDSSTTTGLLCNAGDFSANGTSDYLSLDNAALNGLTDFSISVWAKTQNSSAQAIVSGSSGSQHNEIIMWFPNASTFQPHLKGSSSGGGISVGFNDDSWHHLFWTRTGSQNCLYIDGSLRSCVSRSSQALTIASGGLIIAQEQDSLAGSFDPNQDWEGLLDELMIFDVGLSATDATQIYTNQLAGNNWDGSPRTCPAANVDHYQITHSGSSPACLAAPITIRAHDNSDILISPSTGTTINVSTSNGLGNWSAASSASGAFAAGSAGSASYTFASGENAVDLFLAHSAVANGIDIDVSDGSATDQDGIAEDDPIDFVETAFIFLANGVVNNISTQISGKDSTVVSSLAANQTVALQAVRTDTNTGACVAAIQSPQDVNLSYECRNPASCENTATLTLAGANIASNNNGSSSNSTTVPLNFDTNGVAQLGGLNYSDAGLIRLHAQSNLVATGAHPASTLTGSSNEFVVKPAGLCVQAIATTLADPMCGAPYYNCSKFVAAATDFNLEVSGRAWGGLVESNAALCNNAVTPNFVVGPINLTHNLIAPSVSSGGAVGSIAVASTAINDKGKRTINQQFSEVGVIDVTATLPTASPYINNETVAASSSAPIGRFIPDKFTLTAGSITEACLSATGFTYMGQNFVANYTLNAVNALGAPTTNYAGSFTKGMQTGWPQFGGVDGSFAATSLGRLDNSAGTSISWAAVGATTAGQGSAVSPLQLSRAALDGPYTLNVGVQVEDTDGVRIGDNLTLSVGANSFAPIGQSNQRYGRVQIENAFGSELVDLSVPVTTEYFDAIQNRFLLNTGDSCTALIDTDVAITDASAEPIVPSDTSVISPVVLESLTAGISEIIFAAPGAGNDGSLNINLSVDNWLKFNWLGAGDVNPTSRITFGTYRGNDRVIYRHEVLQ